ncbi:MAG: hypothetical protein AAB270_06840 [Chloroflexota bacterium]
MRAGQARGPLTGLVQLLRQARPPRLSLLVEWLEGARAFEDFKRLVREFLPDQEQEILGAGGPYDMVAAFVPTFGERYFPLADGVSGDWTFSDLLQFIPIEVYGLEFDDYHELPHYRLGFILASLLVDFETEMGLDGEGIRVTAVEAAAKQLPRELLQRIPERGYSLKALAAALGDQYPGLLYHARHLCHETGNGFLDVTQEGLWPEPPEWSRELVEELTEEWEEARKMMDESGRFLQWLEENPEEHFSELLDFLEGKPKVPPEQMPLPLEFEGGNR